jgi:hypothetical protein
MHSRDVVAVTGVLVRERQGMAFWKRSADRRAAQLSPSGGDGELEELLADGRLDVHALAELLAARRGSVESRGVAVHMIGLDPRLGGALRRADPDDATVRLLAAVRAHNLAWASRGRAVTSLTAEQQFVEFHEQLQAAEEQLGMLALELPDDEVPLWYLVSCARGLGRGHDVALDRLGQLREVAPTHRRGHSHALRYLGAKWDGSEQAIRDFAWRVSEGHPAGTVLHGLVAESLVEIWVGRLAGSGAPDAAAAEQLWREQSTRDELDLSWAAYAACEDLGAPWRVRDLNTFVFAFCRAGMADHAAQAVSALNGRVSEYPWRYVADDDVTVPFLRETRALGGAR